MEAFGTVIIVASLVAAVVAIVSYVGAGKLYQGIGKGQFALDDERPRGPEPGTAAARAEADAELRQMLEAKSYRREARGEAPLDVEAELRALSADPGARRDAELVEEIRQLVVARNERRMRRGEEPLDVDAEVERELRDLGM